MREQRTTTPPSRRRDGARRRLSPPPARPRHADLGAALLGRGPGAGRRRPRRRTAPRAEPAGRGRAAADSPETTRRVDTAEAARGDAAQPRHAAVDAAWCRQRHRPARRPRAGRAHAAVRPLHERRAAAPTPRRAPNGPASYDLSSAQLLRPSKRPPQTGWRRALFVGSGGLVNPGESAGDAARRELIARVNQPLHGLLQDRDAEPQGRRRQDHDDDDARVDVRVAARRPRDRRGREPGPRHAEPEDPARDHGDRAPPAARRQPRAALLRRPRLHLAGPVAPGGPRQRAGPRGVRGVQRGSTTGAR